MCGIVGVVAERNSVPILMEGLRRLEYRGYDSAGIAVLEDGRVARVRTVGKVKILQDAIDAAPVGGHVGIAHTRWATHGVPTTQNAHPHISRDGVAIVHNGIIENHEVLRTDLKRSGYIFTSETDTEVIAHRIHQHLHASAGLFDAVRKTVGELQGAYALAVVCQEDPECIVVAREGCPVVIGLGIGENFVASDVAALLPVTRRFMFLEEGDVAEIRRKSVKILDASGLPAERPVRESDLPADSVERGPVPPLHAEGNPRAVAGDRADAGGAYRRRQAARRSFRPDRRNKYSAKSKRCTSPPAERASMRALWPVISSSSFAEFLRASRLPANIAIAIPSSRRIPCS